jgi:LmbE family N-acetylglucosaminyl deacetylase
MRAAALLRSRRDVPAHAQCPAGGEMLPAGHVLAIVAHPDDESFGLGGVLSTLAVRGARVSVLCFTHGEKSTLGTEYGDLAVVRRAELSAAVHVLGINHLILLPYPDGRLAEIPLETLRNHVLPSATDMDTLLVFDEGGVTGHPDHCRATEAALAAAEILDLPVLAWALPKPVAEQLNAEFGTSFVGREETELDLMIEVDRTRQLEAIACHSSQSAGNAVLWRRLSLLGNSEWLRWLRLAHGQPMRAHQRSRSSGSYEDSAN